MLSGSCVALVTPFKDGVLDEKKLRALVEFHIANKTSAIVPCGTTGESATLTYEEHHRVIDIVIQQVKKRIPVIAGTGSNSTAETIELTRHAKESGADAALIIVPYYNKPTQRGMIEHFSAVLQNVSLPIIIYNIPGRTGVNMTPSTLIQIAKRHKLVVGVKEASGILDQSTEIAVGLKDRTDFSILSGDDSLTLPIMSVGGKGVISVLANIVPKDVAELCSSYLGGNSKRAQELHFKMYPLVKALFIETNPEPIKTAMEILGLCSSEMRLPMCAISEDSKKKLTAELKNYGLIK